MSKEIQTGESSSSSSSSAPIFFDVPSYGPPSQSNEGEAKFQLHAADDLFTLYDLIPLWERSVKPFAVPSKSMAKQLNLTNEKDETQISTRAMERTYADYVKDLPGKVKPPKKVVNKFNSILANSNNGNQVEIPKELTGNSTMREIVFRPETTIQKILPFDEESLKSAFTVCSGKVAGIDISLLESDEIEENLNTNKKRKKRKHQNDSTTNGTNVSISEQNAAKRTKLNAFVGNRSK